MQNKKYNIILASMLHVSEYYGGNEHYLHYLGQGLHDAGHTVTYLTSSANNRDNYPYAIATIHVNLLLNKPLPSYSWIEYLARKRPHIFHTSGSGIPLMTTALLAQHRYQIKTVHTYQAPTHPTSGALIPAAMLEQSLIPRAHNAVIATNPILASKLQETWQWADVSCIPMMLAPHFFTRAPRKSTIQKKYNIPADRPIVLFVGQLDSHHYYKNLDTLLEAMPLLPEEYMLLIAGDGDLRKKYEQSLSDKMSNGRYRFLGKINNQEIHELYTIADVFVLPSNSDSEGFGLVLLEAMSQAVPTIITNAIASADWFRQHEVTTIIPANNPSILAQTIVRVAEHPDTNQISRAKSFAREFTQDKMVQNTLAKYDQLLS